MIAGRDVPGIRYGMYFCPGAAVAVDALSGTWRGQILSIGLGPNDVATVAVTDPGGNPHRVVGQRVICPVADLRLVTQ